MLTKEEYEKALSKLWDNTFGTDCITGEDLDKYVDIIDGLIQYVFNPQPLKFEELKDEMWVWDNKEKKYIKSCNNFDTEEYGKGIRVQIGFDLVRYPYEENRFYRKQVEE